VTVYHELMRAI